jgi:hypothetical protein
MTKHEEIPNDEVRNAEGAAQHPFVIRAWSLIRHWKARPRLRLRYGSFVIRHSTQ